MPTENKVFTKLFSDKKVELSMIEDMSYLALVLGGTTIDFEIQIDKVKNEIANLEDLIPGSTQTSVDLITKMEDFREISQELGISDSETEKTLSVYKNQLDNYYTVVKDVDEFLAKL